MLDLLYIFFHAPFLLFFMLLPLWLWVETAKYDLEKRRDDKKKNSEIRKIVS